MWTTFRTNRIQMVITLLVVQACGAAQPGGGAQSKRAPYSCDAPPIPAYIQNYLKEKYLDWRIKQPSDFRPESDPYSRLKDWLWFTHRRCPGVAVGKFQPGPELTYAFLLVPAASAVSGFRLLVVHRGARAVIASQVLASPRPEDGGWEDVDWFIRSVKIWGYAGNPKSDVPPESEDGILIYGGGHGIFAWESGRYVNGFQDTVDRDQ
jgi:hypothetical protein